MPKQIGYYRWPFRVMFKNGTKRVYWFRVILATEYAYPILRAEHVEEAIRRKGVGDTQNCSEAVCTQYNPDAFKHKLEGTIDFTYRRAAVASEVFRKPRRLRKGSNLLVDGDCYLYGHNHADIAKLNDSPNGQYKLLAMLRKNGPIQQTFYPLSEQERKRSPGPRSKKRGRRTGERTRFQRGTARAAFAIAALETPTVKK